MRPTRAIVRACCSALVVVALGMFAAGVPAADAVVGSWSMSTRLGERSIDATMVLSLDDQGRLQGSWASQGREMPLAIVVVDG